MNWFYFDSEGIMKLTLLSDFIDAPKSAFLKALRASRNSLRLSSSLYYPSERFMTPTFPFPPIDWVTLIGNLYGFVGFCYSSSLGSGNSSYGWFVTGLELIPSPYCTLLFPINFVDWDLGGVD